MISPPVESKFRCTFRKQKLTRFKHLTKFKMILNKIYVRGFALTSCRFKYNDKVKDLLDSAATGDDIKPKNPEDVWSTSPYPEEAVFQKRDRDQSKKERRPRRDPKDTSIVLFPGQGAQYVGMAKHIVKIPEARDMFEIASQVLG